MLQRYFDIGVRAVGTEFGKLSALHFIFELHMLFLSFLRLSSASEETCSDMMEFAGGKYFL